jgi:hypothetical protein
VAGGPPFYSLGQLTEQIADSALCVATCAACRDSMTEMGEYDNPRRAAITMFMALPALHAELHEEKTDARIPPPAAD